MATINAQQEGVTLQTGQFGGAGGAPRARARAAANDNLEDIDVTDANRIPIPDWLLDSGLMPIREEKREKKSLLKESCLFQPLKCCRNGALMNGFCAYHMQEMLNVKLEYEATYNRVDDKFVHTQRLRKLINIPRPYRAQITPVFPLLELFDSLPERNEIRLTLFEENLRTLNQRDHVTLLGAHVKFLHRILQLFSNERRTGLTSKTDNMILQHYLNWSNFMSYALSKKKASLRLVVEQNGAIRYLNVSEASLITQALVRCFEIPYAILPNLLVLGGVPAYSAVFERHITLDDSKAINGTKYDDGVLAKGDPATLSLNRIDVGKDPTHLLKNFKVHNEVCNTLSIEPKRYIEEDNSPLANVNINAVY